MTKPKSKDISPNKISDKEERRAENIKDRLQDQGVGQDEARRRGLTEAVEEIHSGEGGGGNSGGGAKHPGTGQSQKK